MKILKPCPFCGNEQPFSYVSAWSCVLRCSCGIEVSGSSVRTVYKRDNSFEALPKELEPYATPAELLVIRTRDGDVRWPEHGYWSVPVDRSFEHFGHAAKWNRRHSENNLK